RRGQAEPDGTRSSSGGGGDQDLVLGRRGANAGSDVHALAGEVAALSRRLGRVQSDPNRRGKTVLATVAHEAALDVDRALDAVDGALERHEETVARVIDLVATVLGN